jgi:hypothetical protein
MPAPRFITLLGCLAAIPSALGMGHNCNQLFWPHVSPEDPNLYECTLYLTEQVNGVTVNIAHYARDWVDTANTSTTLASIQASASDSINAYQKFTSVPDLTFNVVATNLDANTFASSWIPQVGTSCAISVYPNALTETGDNQKQIFAHEIYHCVQALMLSSPAPDWDEDGSQFAPYDWWLDGSADYMSNLVYPTNNFEYGWEESFDPSKRIFRQSYAASIFFQWMESLGSPGDGTTVNDFVADQTFSSSYIDERNRLAARSDFNDLFLGFMEADKEGDIEDTDQLNTVPELPVVWSVLTSPELNPTATFEIDLKTFTGNESVISLDQGQTVSISYDTSQDQLVMVYMTENDSDWSPVPNDASNAITIDVPCGDTGLAVTFLTISTDAVSTASAIITVPKPTLTAAAIRATTHPPAAPPRPSSGARPRPTRRAARTSRRRARAAPTAPPAAPSTSACTATGTSTCSR